MTGANLGRVAPVITVLPETHGGCARPFRQVAGAEALSTHERLLIGTKLRYVERRGKTAIGPPMTEAEYLALL